MRSMARAPRTPDPTAGSPTGAAPRQARKRRPPAKVDVFPTAVTRTQRNPMATPTATDQPPATTGARTKATATPRGSGRLADRTQADIRPDMRELGLPGTKILAGLVFEEDNPDLQGLQGLQTWKDMGFDPTVRSLYLAYTLPIRGSRWFVQPASDDPVHVEWADFVHHNLWEFGTQSFDDVMRQALEDKQYGFSTAEICYDVMTDGQYAGMVGWSKFAYRSQLAKWRWNVEEVDTPGGGRIRELVSLTQLAPPNYETVDIPREKLMLWVNEQQGENYDGWSLFRYCYKPWFYKDLLTRLEAIGLERAYMGIPYAKLPEDWSEVELQAAITAVTNLRTHENAGVILSEAIPLEVIQMRLEGSAMRAAVDWWDTAILQSGLMGWLKLGQNRGGAYSLAQEMDFLSLLCLNAAANRLAEPVNLWPGIPLLLAYNYQNIDPSALPKLTHGDIGQRNLDKLGRVLQALGQWGFLTPDPETEDQLRRFLDLPERDDTVTPEALRDLVEEVMPKLPEFGKQYGPEAPAPMVQVAQIGAQSRLSQAQAQQAATATARKRGGSGAGDDSNEDGGDFAERWASARGQYLRGRARLREAQARMPWPRLEHTPENRPRAQAAYMLAETLQDWYSDVHSAPKPDRPSVALAKRRKPYVLLSEQEVGSAVGRKTVRMVNRLRAEGRFTPVRKDGRPVQADAPDAEVHSEPRPVPQYEALRSRHEAALREALS